jgi:hypothetical protein
MAIKGQVSSRNLAFKSFKHLDIEYMIDDCLMYEKADNQTQAARKILVESCPLVGA